ncbi:MAG TPA: FtsH protease activity modulator HflK [Vicinamibacteria bacterium]
MARGGWTQGPVDEGPPRPLRMLPLRGRPDLRAARPVLIVAGLIALFFTSYYQIEPDEVGVVQRFGRYVGISDPGPHVKIPFVDSVTKVPVQRTLKLEFGFRTQRAGIKSEFAAPTPETAAESAMLTGDLNVAVVEWVVQYKIKDPKKYLFDVREPTATFHDMSEAVMRQVVGDHSVDEVLTIGRETIARQAKQELQGLCDLYETGIEVQQLVLQDVNPPDPVKPAFNEVNQAIQEKERAINDAWADYNKSVPKAKGEADQAIRAAEGYALERVNKAEGDASRFSALYEEYRKAPVVTRRRLYLETLAQALPRIGRTLVLDEKAKGLLPLLNLEPQKERTP